MSKLDHRQGEATAHAGTAESEIWRSFQASTKLQQSDCEMVRTLIRLKIQLVETSGGRKMRILFDGSDGGVEEEVVVVSLSANSAARSGDNRTGSRAGSEERDFGDVYEMMGSQ